MLYVGLGYKVGRYEVGCEFTLLGVSITEY